MCVPWVMYLYTEPCCLFPLLSRALSPARCTTARPQATGKEGRAIFNGLSLSPLPGSLMQLHLLTLTDRRGATQAITSNGISQKETIVSEYQPDHQRSALTFD